MSFLKREKYFSSAVTPSGKSSVLGVRKMIPRPFGRQKDPPPNVTEGLEKAFLEEASPTYQLDQVQFSHVLHFL